MGFSTFPLDVFYEDLTLVLSSVVHSSFVASAVSLLTFLMLFHISWLDVMTVVGDSHIQTFVIIVIGAHDSS